MIRKQIKLNKICSMASFVAIVLGIAVFALPGIAIAQSYEGSEFCQECHEVNYSLWKVSGHPYKLMKSEEARNRPIPLPIGYSWDDISYVIGGYKWKSRYIDLDGYIITTTFDEDGNEVPGVNQYNNLVGIWSDYHAGEEDKPYDCGSCHTTNWVENPDPTDLTGNQDGMPGMWGTFDEGGIQCEQCHGNGMTMEIDDSAEFCGSCHFRDYPPGGENQIPASGGFIRHHEQYNEHLAGAHDFFDCVRCHDPHKRGEFSIKETAQCGVSCHADKMESYSKTSMYDYGVECKDCHMPYASKSAQALGPHKGDLQTHIFRIDTDPTANMFTDDGLFVRLDDDGEAKVTMDFTCQRCHETAALTELGKFAVDFHSPEKSLADIGLNPGLTGTWWNSDRAGEGFLLEFGAAPATGALTLFFSFYTYDSLGNQVWLVGNGPAPSGTSITVNVNITDGAMWGADFDTADVVSELWGTATFDFPTCSSASVSLAPNQDMVDAGFADLSYDLTRDLLESGIQCPTFVNNAP
jgi:hypothetical protein